MAKAIINKHIDNISELKDTLFISDNGLSKGEIVICNDKDNPSIYIKNTEGNITKIAGGSNGESSYDDTELRAQINENTNEIKELKEKGSSVNIAESEEEKTESNEEINKNFLEYEDEGNGLKSLAVRSIDTDATILQRDITVAGIKSVLGSGKYKNGDIIHKGTSIYEIIQNILCQEQYPENVINETASASALMNNLTLTLDKTNTVEVGTLIKLTEGKTNGSEYITSPSKVEGMTWGYSFENNDTRHSEDTQIEKVCTTSISNNTYTISAKIDSGFNADATTYVKTTPETRTGDGSASLDETNLGCAVEGENKITISATGASYTYHADAIDKVYYCSNLGNTDENEFNEGISEVSGTTNIPTNSTSKTVTGKYYYFFGYSEKTRYEDFTSDDIRALIKSDWVTKDGVTVIVGEEKTVSNGKSIVVACPKKYKLSTFDSGVGASIIPNFTSVGIVSVKTGLITSEYNVYVYPITNNAIVEYKNITLTKA